MIQRLALIALLFGLLVTGQAQEKKSEAKNQAQTASPVEKPRKPGQPIAGRVAKLDAEKRTFAIEVSLKIPQPNNQAIQRIAQIQGEIAQARLRGDVNQMRNLQNEAARQQPVTYKDEKKLIECSIEDDAKIRTLILPLEYTDKGKPRRLTEKERRDLKGPDSKLKGFVADMDNLQMDQIVEVYPLHLKEAPKPRGKQAAPPPPPEKNEKGEKVEEELPKLRVSMIVILAEANR